MLGSHSDPWDQLPVPAAGLIPTLQPDPQQHPDPTEGPCYPPGTAAVPRDAAWVDAEARDGFGTGIDPRPLVEDQAGIGPMGAGIGTEGLGMS